MTSGSKIFRKIYFYLFCDKIDGKYRDEKIKLKELS